MNQIAIAKIYETDFFQLPEYHKKWKIEILDFKKNIKRKFSPSMKSKLEKELEDLFQDAAELVAFEYEVNLPKQCPYSLEQLL